MTTMIKTIIHHIKLLLLILLNLFHRFKKYVQYIWFDKHEIERICDFQSDMYEKTMRIDEWLARTNCEPLRVFMNKNFDSRQLSEDSSAKRAFDKVLSFYSKNALEVDNESPEEAKKKTDFKKGDNGCTHESSNLEDCDVILHAAVRELTEELVELVQDVKHLQRMSTRSKECLCDSLYRILCYKMSLLLAERLAGTKYDGNLDVHTKKLISLWNNLVRADQECQPSASTFPPGLSSEISDKGDIVSNRWSHIGFQGEDPGTDFRGMGMLGLAQLEYLSTKPKGLARDLLKRSLNEEHSYPFAIVGINITYNLLELFRRGSMKHLYYDTGDPLFRGNQQSLKIFATFNDIYVELFLRFDCFWHESKPETIFEFKALMEKFINVIMIDLCNRNFSMKFIY